MMTANATLDAQVAALQREFADMADMQYRARHVVEKMAVTLQASLLGWHAHGMGGFDNAALRQALIAAAALGSSKTASAAGAGVSVVAAAGLGLDIGPFVVGAAGATV